MSPMLLIPVGVVYGIALCMVLQHRRRTIKPSMKVHNDIISITIVPLGKRPFQGHILLQTLLNAGYEHKSKLFSYQNDDLCFYLLSATEPGHMCLETMSDATYHGITLFFSMEGCQMIEAQFDLMESHSHALAAELEGKLLCHQKQPWHANTRNNMKQQILDYQHG
jgi:FtsZ-interacting cell division protein ZipA